MSVVQAAVKSVSISRTAFSSRAALLDSLHPTVQRYVGSRSEVEFGFHRLGEVLEAVGLEKADSHTQPSRSFDGPARQDMRSYWHKGDVRIRVAATIFEEDAETSHLAIEAHCSETLARPVLTAIQGVLLPSS